MERLAFDKEYYPYIIFGTGPAESIMTASLATFGHNSGNFDFQDFYSGPMKTLTMKELEKLHKNMNSLNPLVNLKSKDFTFDFVGECTNFKEFIDQHGFRNFNIDYQPRVIFSDAVSTDYLVEAHIDDYMSFNTVKSLYFFMKKTGKFAKVPTDKGDIFKSPDLSMMEKKYLFKFINLAMRLCSAKAGFETDLNSISDFEKQVYAESVDYLNSMEFSDEKLMNSPFVEFLEKANIKSELIIQLVTYSQCNYYTSPYSDITKTKECMLTKEFLGRIHRFLKSQGQHGDLPYLYPLYGIGDVAQILTRVSAVYFSMFVLDKDVTVKSIKTVKEKVKDLKQHDLSGLHKEEKKDEEKVDVNESDQEEETQFEVEFVFKNEVSKLKCKNFIVGPEFRESISQLLVDDKIATKEDLTDKGKLKGFPQSNVNIENNDEYVEKISRLSIICKIEPEENKDLSKKLPLLAVIPEKTIEIPLEDESSYTHEHPISIFVTNSRTATCPEGFIMISARLKEDLDISQNEKIRKGLSETITKYFKDLLELSKCDVNLIFYHNDEIKDKLNKKFEIVDEKNQEKTNKVVFLGDLDANYDFEEVFENTKFVIDELLNKPKTLFNRKDDTVIVNDGPPKDSVEAMQDDIEEFNFD